MILVDLPRELEKQNELQTVIGMVRDRGDCDVVIDFSHVDVVGGACLAGLVEAEAVE
jgi:anti-anti-sigma regulatory factor